MLNKSLLYSIAIAVTAMLSTIPAIAEEYYPLVVSTINSATGEKYQHTIYVPLTVAESVAQNQTVYTAENVTLPSNPWADTDTSTGRVVNEASERARKKNANTKPNTPKWTGTNTTWNTSMGQEAIAPEINKANMLSLTAQLRKLGYIVPDSLDEAIRTAPEKTRIALLTDLDKLQNSGGKDSPMFKAIGKISRDLEANYGFSFQNILDNSMRILNTK